MVKWYENVKLSTDYNFVSSRIRLSRNLEGYVFPESTSEEENKILTRDMLSGLSGIGVIDARDCINREFFKLGDVEKQALRERRVINSVIAHRKEETGLITSDTEEISLVINGDDHIRLQLLSGGLMLEELWKRADRLDDYINEKFRYAFDEKYGYLTAYPTNVGTGMRANIVLHMPLLSKGKSFSNLILGLSRFGVSIKGVYGEGQENCGCLYDISNSKTLGHSEREIIDQVTRVAMQLNSQEAKVRRIALSEHRIDIEDEVYKAYGVLKYARKLTLKDSLKYLSILLQGAADNIIKLKNPQEIYSLIFGVQPAHLLKRAQKPLAKDEMNQERAAFLRKNIERISE